QYGVHRAQTTEEMIDVAYACRRRIYPTGRRLGIMTISGGGGVLMADAASAHGLDVAPMPAEAQAEIKDMLPYAAPRNPVDVTGQFYNDMDMVARAVRLMLEKGRYDAIAGFFTTVAGSQAVSGRLRETFKSGTAGFEDRLIAMSLIAPDDVVAAYEADGFPIFGDPSRAVAAIAALCGFGEAFARAGEAPAAPFGAAALPEGPMGEREAKAVLRAAGLPVVEDRLAATADEAVAAWQAFDGPVVMKIASPDILHKTEIGGVLLDVAGAEAVREGFDTLIARARETRPEARVDGVLVSPMVGDGVECILGVTSDPIFGPMVLFGLGGIFAEVLEDVTFRRAPFGLEEAHRMLGEIKGAAVLDGVRGQPPADRDALAQALVDLAAFAAAQADEIASIDLNPVRARSDGVVALDALIVRSA
ncbi:MAG: acetate--CoA ligase family protein, partial [Hyphomicrobiales bacterium]|nr:acetate--CoA ligase family protein [Hyphomicrobiales bacterium]